MENNKSKYFKSTKGLGDGSNYLVCYFLFKTKTVLLQPKISYAFTIKPKVSCPNSFYQVWSHHLITDCISWDFILLTALITFELRKQLKKSDVRQTHNQSVGYCTKSILLATQTVAISNICLGHTTFRSIAKQNQPNSLCIEYHFYKHKNVLFSQS